AARGQRGPRGARRLLEQGGRRLQDPPEWRQREAHHAGADRPQQAGRYRPQGAPRRRRRLAEGAGTREVSSTHVPGPQSRDSAQATKQPTGASPIMRVLSVNVALPRAITRDGLSVTTAIFKEPVVARVPLRQL